MDMDIYYNIYIIFSKIINDTSKLSVVYCTQMVRKITVENPYFFPLLVFDIDIHRNLSLSLSSQ